MLDDSSVPEIFPVDVKRPERYHGSRTDFNEFAVVPFFLGPQHEGQDDVAHEKYAVCHADREEQRVIQFRVIVLDKQHVRKQQQIGNAFEQRDNLEYFGHDD